MQTTVNEHIHVRVQSNIHVITIRLQYKIITNSFVSYSRLWYPQLYYYAAIFFRLVVRSCIYLLCIIFLTLWAIIGTWTHHFNMNYFVVFHLTTCQQYHNHTFPLNEAANAVLSVYPFLCWWFNVIASYLFAESSIYMCWAISMEERKPRLRVVPSLCMRG